MMTKTTISAKNETVVRDWYVIDATNKVLGRLSTEVADMLRGRGLNWYEIILLDSPILFAY